MEENTQPEGLQFFDSAESLQQSLSTEQAPQESPQPESTPYVDPEAAPVETQEAPEEQPVQEAPVEEPQQDLEQAVYGYLSERLGREVTSLDQINQQPVLDERLQVIADFVENTGRSPQDWFAYQSLDPSSMDDMTAIRVKLASDYPNLSAEELSLLADSKYKLDEDLHSEEDVKLSKLQMKLDAQNARESIEEIRGKYQEPGSDDLDADSIFDDEWMDGLDRDISSMDGIEFDLGNGESFTFGLNDEYKSDLREVNSRLEDYFDPYIREDGSWDYESLNAHRAVIDNIDAIVAAAYKQGQSDGQRGLVDRASNVSQVNPSQNTGQPNVPNVADQLSQIMGGQRGLTFKL
tara:strand:- start:895 stop:1944 length:1050 start_codon:yes stop_codon:yes gene_type:complete